MRPLVIPIEVRVAMLPSLVFRAAKLSYRRFCRGLNLPISPTGFTLNSTVL